MAKSQISSKDTPRQEPIKKFPETMNVLKASKIWLDYHKAHSK
jgi:hypothetical protein